MYRAPLAGCLLVPVVFTVSFIVGRARRIGFHRSVVWATVTTAVVWATWRAAFAPRTWLGSLALFVLPGALTLGFRFLRKCDVDRSVVYSVVISVVVYAMLYVLASSLSPPL